VLGDFNLIYEVSNKNNLNLNRRLMGKFRVALNDCEIFEFALQDRKFTWSNEQEDPTMIRLDQVFCNSDWDLLHSGFRLQALSSSVFDHCPLVLC
jgi:endonuclease/exonuclease/phosphatase family metal-dependent hydrolase